MKLKFVEQSYQTDAVKSVVDVFDGCEVKESMFTIRSAGSYSSSLFTEEMSLISELGYANKCTLTDNQILENIRKVQERHNIQKDSDLITKAYSCPNLTVEMETGTGKTYVYTETILELNKRYGFTKFIIVVPSVAIKEGVYKSLQVIMKEIKI